MSQYSLAQWSLLTRVPQKQNQGVGRTVFLSGGSGSSHLGVMRVKVGEVNGSSYFSF